MWHRQVSPTGDPSVAGVEVALSQQTKETESNRRVDESKKRRLQRPPQPGRHNVILREVGLLTHHLPISLSAFSLASASNGSSLKERRGQSITITSGTQRPDRPGITPEFPVHRSTQQRPRSPRTFAKSNRRLRKCQLAICLLKGCRSGRAVSGVLHDSPCFGGSHITAGRGLRL